MKIMCHADTYNFDRYVMTEIVTVTLRSNPLPLRNLRVMYLRVSNFRCRYLHAVSTSPLHNTYTWRSCASHSRRQEPPVYSKLLSPSVLRFCPRYQPVIPTKTRLPRQDNEHRCLHRAFLFPFPFHLTRGRFLRYPFPCSLCLSSVTHRRLWTASRTRAN